MTPPRTLYGGIMAPVVVIGVVLAAAMSHLAGGGQTETILAGLLVAMGSLPSFAPALAGRATTWGLVVVGGSMARLLLTLALALVVVQTRAVDKSPLLIGIGIGAGVILVIESAVAVWLLSRMQRRLAERA